MNKEEAKKLPKYKQNPLLQGLPDYLKDPANFKKVQKALFDVLQSSHSHSEIIDWHECFPCQQRVRDHKEMMLKLGFKSPAQYSEWQKVMDTIKRRVPLR